MRGIGCASVTSSIFLKCTSFITTGPTLMLPIQQLWLAGFCWYSMLCSLVKTRLRRASLLFVTTTVSCRRKHFQEGWGCFLFSQSQKIGWPILRVLGEGWDEQNMRGKGFGLEQ